MARSRNAEIERYYFELFQSVYPTPDGSIEFSDRPDIIIHGTRKVGIEISNLYLLDGSDTASEQVQRRFREKVINIAENIYKKRGGRAIDCWFDFNKEKSISDINSVAEKIAILICENQNTADGFIPKNTFKHIAELRSIYSNGREYSDAKWQIAQTHSTPSLSTHQLKALISKKEVLLNKYQHCDEYWLLIIVDFLDPSQDQYISLSSTDSIPKSPFTRIIIYKPYFNEVTTIPFMESTLDLP